MEAHGYVGHSMVHNGVVMDLRRMQGAVIITQKPHIDGRRRL